MSKKEKNCLNCRIYWDREGGCEVCRWEDEDHPSLFYQITRSPEVLAANIVYMRYDHEGDRYMWTSPWIPTQYSKESEAIAATLTVLKKEM